MTNVNEDGHQKPKDELYAKAITTVLQEEFGVSFSVYDATAGTRLWPQTDPEGQICAAPRELEEWRQLADAGRSCLTLLPRGGYRLRLPVSQNGRPILMAEAVLPALASDGPDAGEERRRLQGWAQAVLERWRQSDLLRSRRRVEEDLKTQLKHAWELNLTLERLIRHVRVHKDDAASQHQILEAALPFVEAQALIWVPKKPGPVPMQGETILAAEDARSLVSALRREPELRESGLLLCNQVRDKVWGDCVPNVDSLLTLAIPTGTPVGWLLALNKQPPHGSAAADRAAGVGFRRADAATLAPFAALLGLQFRSRERYQDLKDLLVGLMRSLASAVDAKDPYTYGHSERVARIAVELGRELSLHEDQLSDLYLAGLLHDIGKIGIREEVLCKHGPLTAEETEHMRQHPTIGHAILQGLHQISSLLPGVLYHHERYDGRGYPAGLAGERIPLLARVLAVADTYDAMSTSRPYRTAMSPARVEEILTDGAGAQWDPRVIEAFQRCLDRLRLIHERGLGESLRQALDGALRDSGSSLAWPMAPEGPAVRV